MGGSLKERRLQNYKARNSSLCVHFCKFEFYYAQFPHETEALQKEGLFIHSFICSLSVLDALVLA